MDNTTHLYDALAAILNALESAGEQPIPITCRGHSSITGTDGRVEADKVTGRWIAQTNR
jgi:hypothetical protein